MAVPLRLTPDGRVEVDAHVTSRRFGARGVVVFIVDTGSRKTILGVRDAETLGFPVGGFPPYAEATLAGIGGRGRPFDVGQCQIVLGDAEIVVEESLLYFRPERETRVRVRGGDQRRESWQRVFAVPSLLGTDLLRRNRCVLRIDWGLGTGDIRRAS